ncbi:Hypothetical protein CINCED_3A000327 [Cinara cedri]|uniref:Uncharacterized protein n=1 Tax=Cinara cedri TaxID=506608 RepID=A0A5E4MX74_9HEMI|nr:Hypothetical protein CINCED_3A000327 [Cinara cedri]
MNARDLSLPPLSTGVTSISSVTSNALVTPVINNINAKGVAGFTPRNSTSNEINEILTDLWKKGQPSRFKFNWLSRWPWLAYAAKEGGAFCKARVGYAKSAAGIDYRNLGVLVKRIFDNWKHALLRHRF